MRFGVARTMGFHGMETITLLIDAQRVLAVGVLGPIAEELIFRELFYKLLAHTPLGNVGAIVVTAVGWAILHTSYTLPVILLLLGSSVLLGIARYRSNSVLVPIAMHIVWNLYAIW